MSNSCHQSNLAIISNMYNEIHQIQGWMEMAKLITPHVLIVDTGSTDGTIETAREMGAIVVVDDIIKREGYGPARNHIRGLAIKLFPMIKWTLLLDADERIDPSEFHMLRVITDYLDEEYDVVALPRIDWRDLDKKEAAKDYHVQPDYQARMVRTDSPAKYVRRLHEQISGHNNIYLNLTTPKINHFHRPTTPEKRAAIGKLCAKLHSEDSEWGDTYPKHKYEDKFYALYEEEGLD